MTLGHGATPYVLKEGQTRFAVSWLDVFEDAVAAVGNRVRFEIIVSNGNVAVARIERVSQTDTSETTSGDMNARGRLSGRPGK